MSFLVRTVGSSGKELVSPIDISNGNSDSDKLVKTNNLGVIDNSLIPSDFIPLWAKEVIEIPPSVTASSTGYTSSFVKYFGLVTGGSGSYAFEMNVFQSGGVPLDTVYNKIGSKNVTITSKVVLGLVSIDIVNNELYPITVTLTYMRN